MADRNAALEPLHGTCTSSPLSDISGTDPEHVSTDVIGRVHELKTGTKLSDDPAVARIQGEQAITWAKRNPDKVSEIFEKKTS